MGETALLITSIAGAALGTVTQAVGQAQQARAARQRAEAQAQISRANAETAGRLADDAIARGRTEEQRHRQEVRRLQGTQTAALAASGIDVGSGSALDILSDTAAIGEMDALTIRDNAAREAWQRRVEATNFTNQGQLFQAEADSVSSIAPVGTLLTGTANIADRWWRYRNR